ncbi:MAG: sedoheptulokinase [Blautia sp.]
MKYIGIDVGSSFLKAVLLDLEKDCMIDNRSFPTRKKIPKQNPFLFEIPALQICNKIRKLVDGYTSQFNDIEGVILSTQMHGFVYSVAGRDDTYISWQDMRCIENMPNSGKTYLEYLKRELPPCDMRNCGVYIKPSLGLCNLYTLIHGSDIPQNGTLYTLGSYVIAQLTGNNICHISNAAPMGMADVRHHCWNNELLQRLGLGKIQLPKIAEHDFEVCGIYRSNSCNLKIYPDYGDMQVAVLGSRIQEGEVAVNVATASQVIRYAQKFEPGEYEIRPYFEGGYLNTISNMPAGRNLDVLVSFFQESVNTLTGMSVEKQEIWRYIHQHAGQVRDGLRVQTSFYNNPYFSDGGSIVGITQNNLNISNIFAAAFKDMAQTYWYYIQRLGTDAENINGVICIGGVCWKTPELCEAIAEVIGKNIRLSPMQDEALEGMFRLSRVACGMCKGLKEQSKTIAAQAEEEM